MKAEIKDDLLEKISTCKSKIISDILHKIPSGDEISRPVIPVSTSTYAKKASQPTTTIVPKLKTVIVDADDKPVSRELASTIKAKLLDKLPKTAPGLFNARGTKAGKLVLQFLDGPTSEAVNTLDQLGYRSRVSEPLKPTVSISYISAAYGAVKSTTLLADLRSSNPDVNIQNDDISYLYSYQVKSGDHVAVVRMSPNIRTALLNKGYVTFHNQVCHLSDVLQPRMCSICQQYGHSKANCKGEQRCPFCAETHEPKNCSVKSDHSKHRCANCNIDANDQVSTKHTSFSTQCPRRASEIKHLISRIDWGESPPPSS